MSNSPEMIKTGASEVDITPEVGIWLAGFAARTKRSEGIHSRLYSRAFAFGDGEKWAVLSTNDLIGLARPEIMTIRKLAAARCPGLLEEDIMVTCTHTHSGPAVSTCLRGQPHDYGYIEKLCLMIADNIAEAVKTARPGRLFYARGEVNGFNHNRRNEALYCERGLFWLEAHDSNDNLICGIVNFTAHPSMLTGYLISGDYAGVLAQVLEKDLRCTVGMINGCHGNINGYPRAGENYSLVDTHGAGLAAETLQLRKSIVRVPGNRVQVRRQMVELTFGSPRPRSYYEEISKKLDEPDFVRKWASDVMARYPGEPVDGAEEGEVMVIHLGEAAIIGIPGHAFAETGRDIMAALPGKPVFIANHANDYLGYFGTEQGHREGGYELELAYRFNSSFRWAIDSDTTYRMQNAAINLAYGNFVFQS